MANRLIGYLQESHKELKKVVWPSKQEVTRHTILVIALSLGMAVFLGAVDLILNYILGLIV